MGLFWMGLYCLIMNDIRGRAADALVLPRGERSAGRFPTERSLP